MNDEKYLFLKMHDCIEGLDDHAVKDIASHAELVRYESGDVIHHAEDALKHVYLIVQGRTKHSAKNLHGEVYLERINMRGEQFGGLGAALAEPVPIQVTSYGPSVLLKFDYQTLLGLTFQYELLRRNLSRLIARGARRAILDEKHLRQPRLVAIYHESSASRELTYCLIRRMRALGENPCLFSDGPDPPQITGVRSRSLFEGNQGLSNKEVERQIYEWSDSKRIFFDLQAGDNRINLMDVLLTCGQVFWCLEPEQSEIAIQRLKSIQKNMAVWSEKISVVWILDEHQHVAPCVPELKKLAQGEFKLTFADPKPTQSKVLSNGMERLVHLLRGVRIGVALGGGAARGMAHLGVLKVLERHGIVIDMMAGTSAGAMTGTVMASGMEYDYCTKSFVEALTPSRLFRLLPKGDQWYLLYKYRRGLFDPMLRKYLGNLHLEQLPIPMHTIAVDLIEGQPVVQNQGDAVQAILESINIPVISPPICHDGKALVDGGLVNNVPANVLADEGCNFIIAISVTAKLESRFGKNLPGMPTEKMKSPSILQTILRSHIVQNKNMNSIGVQPADYVIEPNVTDFDLTDFKRTDEIAAVGEQATEESIGAIQGLLGKIDKKLFAPA